MFNSQFWQVLINLLFASFGNIQYHIFANCGKIRFIPNVGKPTFCHFWQLSKLPKLAISEAAKIGNFRSCQNWQLQKLPKLATSEAAKLATSKAAKLATSKAAKIGTFQSCQNWQLQKLPKLASLKAAKTGNFKSCQNWQLHIMKLPVLAVYEVHKLLKLATFRAASKMYHLLFASFGNIQYIFLPIVAKLGLSQMLANSALSIFCQM